VEGKQKRQKTSVVSVMSRYNGACRIYAFLNQGVVSCRMMTEPTGEKSECKSTNEKGAGWAIGYGELAIGSSSWSRTPFLVFPQWCQKDL